jgi:hypothetical protein
MKHHRFIRLFLTILVLLSLTPDSKACYIEYCDYWPELFCYEEEFVDIVTCQECYTYEEWYADGEEYYCIYYEECYDVEEWEYYYEEVCDWMDVWDCWYEWDPSCDGGGGGGNIIPQVTISPDTNQTLNLGQSLVYSSTASASGNALASHDFDWMVPGGNWVSGSSNSAGPGTVALGALTGGADRSLLVDMQTSSTRTITMTPTRPGSYTVRFSSSDTDGEWGHSSTKTLTVDNQAPGLLLRAPSTIFTGDSIMVRVTADNPTGFEHYQTGLEVSRRILNADGTVNQNWSILSTQTQAIGNRFYENTMTGFNQTFIIEFKGRAWNEQWAGHHTSVEKIQRVRVVTPLDPGADGTPEGMTQDSNGNGVPDYVEALLGFDPATPNNPIPDSIRRQYQYDHSSQLFDSPEGGYSVDPEGNVKETN